MVFGQFQYGTRRTPRSQQRYDIEEEKFTRDLSIFYKCSDSDIYETWFNDRWGSCLGKLLLCLLIRW